MTSSNGAAKALECCNLHGRRVRCEVTAIAAIDDTYPSLGVVHLEPQGLATLSLSLEVATVDPAISRHLPPSIRALLEQLK